MCTGGDPGGGSSKTTQKRSSSYTMTKQPNPDVMRGYKSPTFASTSGKTETQMIADNKRAGPTTVSRPSTDQARDMAMAELRGRLDSELTGIAAYSIAAHAAKKVAEKSLANQLNQLRAGATPVQIRSDSGKTITVGTIDSRGRYSGRSEYADYARSVVSRTKNFNTIGAIQAKSGGYDDGRDGPDQQYNFVQEPVKPEEPAVVEQFGSSGALTTARRRGSGRRVAYGTRQSLVNLRNV